LTGYSYCWSTVVVVIPHWYNCITKLNAAPVCLCSYDVKPNFASTTTSVTVCTCTLLVVLVYLGRGHTSSSATAAAASSSYLQCVTTTPWISTVVV
jgi:hypothetical protein